MDIKSDYKSGLFAGCAIEYRDISLFNLAHYVSSRTGYYQVHSQKMKFSKIYKNIDDAVNKFIELKRNA